MGDLRRDAIRDRVRLQVDGREVVAERGEPIAAALIAIGRRTFGRSVKYHRPRGAMCFEGRCDGCLMRVDGVPNVMTCRTPAAEGMVIETQNVVGTARVDLLAATDWFFPDGMDHHHMFTRFAPVNLLMRKVARRVAGVGKLPDGALGGVALREETADVLVVGGGPSGIVAANAAAQGGARVVLVEELTFGGERALLGGDVPTIGPPVDARERVSALAVYDERGEHGLERRVVLGDADGLLGVRCGALIVASGADPGPLPIAGNDRPGVMSARGVLRLMSHGVVPGQRVALVGQGRMLDRAALELLAHGCRIVGRFVADEVEAFEGRPTAKFIRVGGQRLACDAIVTSDGSSAAYPIAAQAGAELMWDGRGFVVRADDQGRTAGERTFAVGRCTGRDGDAEQASAAGRRAAAGSPCSIAVPCGERAAPEALPSRVAETKVVVCRCEDVTLHELKQAVGAGYRDLESVKRYTGFATGWCQGKQCVSVCARMIAAAGGDIGDSPITPRPPLHPIPLAHLARIVDEDS